MGQKLNQLLKGKDEEVAVLENELKSKEEALKDSEAKTIQLMKMKYNLDKNKETIQTLQEDITLLKEELNTKHLALKENEAQALESMKMKYGIEKKEEEI